ncbi:MAG: OmpA family protein, partial [Casimicrobium sp.]
AATPAVAPAVSADFDPTNVAVTTASLPPFPFFKEPEGKRSIHWANPKSREHGFNRFGFLAGKKLITVEGQLFRDGFNLEDTDDGRRKYSALEFHRNYENAITALGGKKISETQFTRELIEANGGYDALAKLMPDMYAGTDYEHYSYLIRTPQKEYWIHVSTGAGPLHGQLAVLERTAMTQSVGFLNAAAMKKEIDAKGRVALYINFDIDKATLRPDAQPIVDEINKLLGTDATLKLSIEGHTDSTGTAERNRELSAQRARSVLGALVGLGIDPARLGSKGFGSDKPIADNANETGRAKNRRVELVKIS